MRKKGIFAVMSNEKPEIRNGKSEIIDVFGNG